MSANLPAWPPVRGDAAEFDPAAAPAPPRQLAPVRWLRRLAALPLRCAGIAMLWLKLPAASGVLRAAWRIGLDSSMGKAALQPLLADAPSALLAAQHMLAIRGDAGVAAMAGLFVLDLQGPDAARPYLELSQRLGGDSEGTTELLELLLAQRQQRIDQDLLSRYAGRRDLAPAASRLLLTMGMWNDLVSGRTDQAASAARRLLEVDDDPHGAIVLAAVEQSRGLHAGPGQRAVASLKMPRAQLIYNLALAAFAVGSPQAGTLAQELAALDAQAHAQLLSAVAAMRARS
jgi:hypothetical protein